MNILKGISFKCSSENLQQFNMHLMQLLKVLTSLREWMESLLSLPGAHAEQSLKGEGSF